MSNGGDVATFPTLESANWIFDQIRTNPGGLLKQNLSKHLKMSSKFEYKQETSLQSHSKNIGESQHVQWLSFVCFH